MTDDLFERRCAERRDTRKLVDYQIVSPQGAVLGGGLARTLNISATGMLLETGQFLEAGQVLRLTVVLGDELVQMNGRVVHSQPLDDDLCSTGVQFVEFTGSSADTFRRYCASLGLALAP